nr:STAS domain-containing protein [Microbispora cellulosiformans]
MTVNGSFKSTRTIRTKNLLYTDPQLSIRTSADGSVRLIGQIDLTNGDAIAGALNKAWTKAGAQAVDVAELKFIDLYGLRALAVLSDSPVGHPIQLDNVRPALRKLLVMLDWPAFTMA